MNDEGQEVIKLLTNDENNGVVIIYNKGGKAVVFMTVYKDDGVIAVFNKNSEVIGHLP